MSFFEKFEGKLSAPVVKGRRKSKLLLLLSIPSFTFSLSRSSLARASLWRCAASSMYHPWCHRDQKSLDDSLAAAAASARSPSPSFSLPVLLPPPLLLPPGAATAAAALLQRRACLAATADGDHGEGGDAAGAAAFEERAAAASLAESIFFFFFFVVGESAKMFFLPSRPCSADQNSFNFFPPLPPRSCLF